jgi:transposase
VDQLTQQISDFKNEISTLKHRLSYFETPKNSSNSSIPPSKDENRPIKNQSLREKSRRNSGGQPGHKGDTLEMTAIPDCLIEHSPDYCQVCGKLLEEEQQLESCRQVVDLPEIHAIWTEHRQFSKQCNCGHKTTTDFPSSVKAPVQYGAGIEALVCYLHGRQYLPYGRMQELIKDSYGVKISQGSIDNIIKRFAQKGSLVYSKIKANVVSSEVIGSDETGIKINSKKHWAWTWQDARNTLISISESRGIQAITENMMGKLPKAILCHDAWRAQFSIECRTHQLCCAHLLRELNYLNELYKQPWGCKFKQLLYKAMKLKNKMLPQEYESDNPERNEIISAYEKLLHQPPDEKYKELKRFHKRIVKYKNYIFPFLYHESVPADNNASERAIRNIKVKQKISGQFRSKLGAENFAVIRSIIDTFIKRNVNVFHNLRIIAEFNS